jgi:endonuclease/exonuclease/phosphatase family metal-dependent hydrolase
MSQDLKVATFNCNNLFNRPAIFMQKNSRDLLEYVAELEDELKKDVYDHKRIDELRAKLEGYVAINNIRGNYNRAHGASEWVGDLKFASSKFNGVQVDNVARVIRDVNADIICLMEVESRPMLQKFHDSILLDKFLNPAHLVGYRSIMLIDGNDERGIDVALMSRYPISWLRSHIDERTTYNNREVPTFSRDCLEARISLLNGKSLHLMINHFKSMGYSPANDPKSNMRRLGQTQRVAELLDKYDLDRELLIVAGDFNADPESPSVAPLVKRQGLYNVNLSLDPNERGTYRDEQRQLDYLLVSNPLKEQFVKARIERRGIYSKKWSPYDTVTGRTTEASDHGAVVADFHLE